MFIARVHVVIKFCRLSKGAIGHQGNTLDMEHDVVSIVNKLQLLPEDSPAFVARKNNPNAPGVTKISKSMKIMH